MHSDGETTVKVTLKRSVGADEVTFEAVSSAAHGQEDYEFARLSIVLRNSLCAFVDDVGATLPTGINALRSDTLVGDWYAVNQFSRTVDRGKTYLKAHAGKWDKYGVVVWPEIAARCGFAMENIETLMGLEVLIAEKSDGKPKVMAIREAQTSE